MKTVTDVNTVNQLLTYSKQAEAGIHQKAIQMLLGAGNNKKQDSLSISDAARGFSKQSIAALIDKNANISNSELAYYFANYNNCLLYTSPSPRDGATSRMPSSA